MVTIMYMYTLFIAIVLSISGCNPAGDYIVNQNTVAEGGSYASALSVDSNFTVVSSVKNGIVVWDLSDNTPLYNWSHRAKDANVVMDIDISFNASHAITADRKAFALWSIKTGEPEGFWKIDESSVRDAAISNNGDGILIGRGNGKVLFFEPKTGRRIEFLGHSEKINSVDLSPNGRYALTGGNDYIAHLWDTKTGQVIYTFNHPSRVTKVKLDPYGRFGFTADSQKLARIWDLKTGKEVSALKYIERQKIFTSVRFSSDGERLVTGSPSRNVTVWEVATGKEITHWSVTANPRSRYSSAVVHDVNFEDINTIKTVSSSGFLETWNVAQP